jgi:isoprenylcysteine carboxyl methyltransferase (ICMT) family protein YpbQ
LEKGIEIIMKNNRKILPIIFAVMLVACVIKIIISPQILDFVGVVAILLVLIDSIIQLNEE